MEEGGRSVDDRYTQWKSLIPVLYDWLANHNLVWPSLSCRWGPRLEQATYKNRQRKDKSVVLWSIHDHISTLALEPGATMSPGSSLTSTKSKGGRNNDKSVDGPVIGPRGIYKGHDDTVEDVEKAHNADIHCLDWNPHDANFILTGSADNTVHMFDRRNLTSGGVGSPVNKFEGHSAAVLCWSPDKSSVFGSSAEDGILNIWDYEKIGKKQDTVGYKAANAPPGLFFRHAGHRDKVVDFHWNTSDPWTIASVSDDCGSTGGGGTLQIWRMIDLIYRPEEEVLAELDKERTYEVRMVTLNV
ncbi:hypothetical protein COLO4_30660 [Corchorus olitorius]|uniref:Uncharacterized protein n=1 Tax=Corchorus olitorius TaxID=93759 RepID=A0A1R3H7F5_9ROSI|nr:hypothetical protein COLO4_30660 [Corchorus olitorius]